MFRFELSTPSKCEALWVHQPCERDAVAAWGPSETDNIPACEAHDNIFKANNKIKAGQ